MNEFHFTFAQIDIYPVTIDGIARLASSTKVYRLRRSICKLNGKNTLARDDVTYRATARKILKKIIDLATRIE